MRSLTTTPQIAILGAGLAGCSAAARLARIGLPCTLIDQADAPMRGASLNNEGKLHLGYVYAADPTGQSWHVMADAAVKFEVQIHDLFSVKPQDICRSTPFLYTVCRDSALDPEAINKHSRAVDTYLRSINAGYTPCRTLPVADYARQFDPDTVSAVFSTPEHAIHSGHLAEAINRSVRVSPSITLHPRCHVRAAKRLESGGFELDLEEAGERKSARFDLVINALWDDRLRLDACAGLAAPYPAIMRYKASILFDQVPPDLIERLPSTTLVSGPFGDLVNRGDGSVYLSWYPVCKLGQTTSMDARSLYDSARSVGRTSLVADSIDGIAQYIPGARDLHRLASKARVGGGVIVAWGETDISDPCSELHTRANIGVAQADYWISINTGKFTTAPAFGIAAAEDAAAALAA